jgi:hypothetical protein
MRQATGLPEYIMLFATRHQRGIEKMKEIMKEIGQDGSLRFCDAWNGQRAMFRADDPQDWALKLRAEFANRTKVPWQEIADFTLNETPFANPRAMLRNLESADSLEVFSSNPKRKRLTFPDKAILFITFK